MNSLLVLALVLLASRKKVMQQNIRAHIYTSMSIMHDLYQYMQTQLKTFFDADKGPLLSCLIYCLITTY